MERPYYIASDVHLGAVPDRTEQVFLRFLAHVRGHGRALLLVGDLFDFWFEYRTVIPGNHFRVLAALAELVDAGVPVTLMGGNHDAWGGRFLREEVGVAFHPDVARLDIAGRPALVAHGDGLGRGDLRYRALKRVLRSRAAVAGFRLLHPDLGVRIARAVSSTEAKSGGDDGLRGRARFLEEWARERLEEDPSLGWVICGHAHLPAIHELQRGRYYLNPGDWINHHTYITVNGAGEPRLHRWGDQAARS